MEQSSIYHLRWSTSHQAQYVNSSEPLLTHSL